MDRMVKLEADQVELHFRPSGRCTAAIKVTSLVHTLPVAVKLTTTRPAAYSFSPDCVALLHPLSTVVFTLVLLPTSAPPLSSPPDSVLVDAVIVLSIHRTNSSALRRLFSRPSLPIFRDASLPIHLLGSHALRSLRFPSCLQRDLLPRLIKSCSPRDLSAVLPLAAHAGAGNAVSALLSAGANPNARNAAGKPAISLAVSAGSAEAVEALLETGAVDRPFYEAAAKNRTDIIALLLAWTGSGSGSGWTAAPDPDGRTPVHYAAAKGALDALRLCLSSGGDPNRTDASGWTPLHCSAAGGHLAAAEFLMLSSDFDLRRALTREKRGEMRRTPFDLAVEKGHAHLYDLLLPGGEVIRAARCGATGDVATAVRATGRVRERDQNGWTALHVAAFKGRVEAARELIESGADLEAVNDANYTPLRCAVEAGHTEVALLLVGYGARAGLKGYIRSKSGVIGRTRCGAGAVSGLAPVPESCAAAVSSALVDTRNCSTNVKSIFRRGYSF